MENTEYTKWIYWNRARLLISDVMAGWAVLLVWSALKPIEKSGLLPITSGFLLLSVIIEFVFISNMLGCVWLVFGVTKPLILSVLFTSAYFNSLKKGC